MRRPWILVQTWENVFFAHWPVDAGRLGRLVPAGLELDLYGGQAWIGVVAFLIRIAPRGLPALRFRELNVRTYVTRGGRSGVYFFSLDASSRLAVRAARRWFHLPYYDAEMSAGEREGWVEYESRRVRAAGAEARLGARYRAAGPVLAAEAGSLADWLTNRLCLFTTDAAGRGVARRRGSSTVAFAAGGGADRGEHDDRAAGPGVAGGGAGAAFRAADASGAHVEAGGGMRSGWIY